MFGIDDLAITSDSNKYNTSSSFLGLSYNHVLIEKIYVPKILAGSTNFQTTEIEVFKKFNLKLTLQSLFHKKAQYLQKYSIHLFNS